MYICVCIFFFIGVYSVRLIKLVYAINGYTLITTANFDITWHSFNVLVLYDAKITSVFV